ncbi:MAG: CoA-binding protein [Candidatus Helarchaeota archaeon]
MDRLELIDSFFHPKSVTLIGVSRNLIGPSGMILSNILRGGYKGPLNLINKNIQPGRKILDQPIKRSLNEVETGLDLVFIIVPSRIVPEVLEECGDRNVAAVSIISAGFAESILYDKEKMDLQNEIVKIARKKEFVFVGPNCNGLFSSSVSLNAIFGPHVRNLPGKISYVTKGGTAGIHSLMATRVNGIGVSKFINIGDEADLKLQDIIEYYGQDPETKVIGAYSEGIKDGPDFVKKVKKITINKPVVFYKSGTTEAGKKAATSHVGAIAGEHSNRIFEGVVKQTGLISVEGIGELIDICTAFVITYIPKGRNACILTAAGSLGVMTSDACNKAGLNLPSIKKETFEKINVMLPEYWSHSNPLDLTDSMDFRAIFKIFKILIEDETFDGIIFLMGNFDDHVAKYVDFGIDFFSQSKQGASDSKGVDRNTFFKTILATPMKKLQKYLKLHNKPLFFLGPIASNDGLPDVLRSYKVVPLPEMNRIAKTFAALAKWGEHSKKKKID